MLVATLGLFPLAVMLLLLFAAAWLSDGQRERERAGSRSHR
ncbi:MAG TPA: hypothetical protein VFJ75_02865 [Gaiellaceae bacterium]|nr:hypothetical protein [Gaiellaceae bacterium]